jgi:hypothetical protein
VIDRLRELLDRPIADRDRRRVFAACAAALVCTAALLLGIGDGASTPDQPPTAVPAPTPSETPRSLTSPPAPASSPAAPGVPGAARSVARRFLRGYLLFLYGRGPAGGIRGATPPLVERLARSRVRVPAAALRRHPSVAEVQGHRLAADRVVLAASVDDGGVSRYPIELTLARRAGRWLVVSVGGD